MTDRDVLNPRWLDFWAGWAAAIGVISLYDDIVGKKRYLRLVRDHWVSPWISVPIAVAMVGWAVWRMTRAGEGDS